MRAPLIGVHVACSLDAFTEGTAPRTGATERRLPHKRGRTYSACPRRDDTGGTRLAKPCETMELPCPSPLRPTPRSRDPMHKPEERRVGQECVRTGRDRR